MTGKNKSGLETIGNTFGVIGKNVGDFAKGAVIFPANCFNRTFDEFALSMGSGVAYAAGHDKTGQALTEEVEKTINGYNDYKTPNSRAGVAGAITGGVLTLTLLGCTMFYSIKCAITSGNYQNRPTAQQTLENTQVEANHYK
jgi:hypothetical protein